MNENDTLEQVKGVIIGLLEKKRSIPSDLDIENYLYMDTGHIDSLGVMKFIFQIEEAFDVEITPKDMESEAFRSVGGLASLIAEKIKQT